MTRPSITFRNRPVRMCTGRHDYRWMFVRRVPRGHAVQDVANGMAYACSRCGKRP